MLRSEFERRRRDEFNLYDPYVRLFNEMRQRNIELNEIGKIVNFFGEVNSSAYPMFKETATISKLYRDQVHMIIAGGTRSTEEYYSRSYYDFAAPDSVVMEAVAGIYDQPGGVKNDGPIFGLRMPAEKLLIAPSKRRQYRESVNWVTFWKEALMMQKNKKFYAVSSELTRAKGKDKEALAMHLCDKMLKAVPYVTKLDNNLTFDFGDGAAVLRNVAHGTEIFSKAATLVLPAPFSLFFRGLESAASNAKDGLQAIAPYISGSSLGVVKLRKSDKLK